MYKNHKTWIFPKVLTHKQCTHIHHVLEISYNTVGIDWREGPAEMNLAHTKTCFQSFNVEKPQSWKQQLLGFVENSVARGYKVKILYEKAPIGLDILLEWVRDWSNLIF